MPRLRLHAFVFSFSLVACGGHDTSQGGESGRITFDDAGTDVLPAGGDAQPVDAMDGGLERVDAATEAGSQDDAATERGSVRFKLISYNVQARPVLDDPRATINLPLIR